MIRVIDEPCGKGKTSFAIQMMNEHPERAYIYCTPFLDEITRIKAATNIDFKEPQFNGGRKIDNFNMLLMSGENIALTHSTFANATAETLEYLSSGEYTLILDEVLDILIDYNDVCADNLTKSDIKLLINEGFITIDDYGKVDWVKDAYPASKYYNVERLAKNGNLFYLNQTMLVWQFPAQIFSAFKQVYILTYLFEGSFLKPYFQYHSLDFELVGVKQTENGYAICQYSSDKEERIKYKELINILSDKNMNNYRNSSLSKTWYEKQPPAEIKRLQANIYNYFRNIAKATSKDIMWTAPNAFYKSLKGKGYNIVRRLTTEENALPKQERAKLETTLKCFVPLNARATNNYKDRCVLVYAFNFYPNPYIKRYFENKNQKDNTDIHVNQDYFALSCLIQWIWRSRIRDGQPISIYIPSERMRQLFIDWLDGKM